MLYAEMFIYPKGRVGILEYPEQWRDLQSCDELQRIKALALSDAKVGKRKARYSVRLVSYEAGRAIPLCTTYVYVRIHDLRKYRVPKKMRSSLDSDEWRGEWKRMPKRLSLAPTITELRAMVDQSLPQIAAMAQWYADRSARAVRD